MGYVRFGLVALNAAAFVVLLGLSIRFQRRETSPRVKRLWLIVAMASAALVIGSIQRLVLQATTLDWLSSVAGSATLEGWQVVQSILVAMLAVGAFVVTKSLADSMAASERIAGSLLDRVSHVDPDRLDLTPRELEVLTTIGRGLVTDADLAAELHISASTVQTHVKSLLKKTGLNRRQDLLAVAYLVESEHTGPGAS